VAGASLTWRESIGSWASAMYRPDHDPLFDFSEKGLPPPPSDPATSQLFDSMDASGDVFAAPELIPDAPAAPSILPDLGPATTTEPSDDDVAFQVPSGATELGVTLEEPTTPAAPPPEATIDVQPPSAPDPASVPDDLSMGSTGELPAAPFADGGPLPPPTAASMPSGVSPAPVSTLSEEEVASAAALLRALTWPGPASSISEAYWRIFLLSLLMHLYAPVGEEEEARRIDFLRWLEIIDWWYDEPSTAELVHAGELEFVWDQPGVMVHEGSELDLQTRHDLGAEHDSWVRNTFPDGVNPGDAGLLRRKAPIDSATSKATWLDYPDAVVTDWARIAAEGRGFTVPGKKVTVAGIGSDPGTLFAEAQRERERESMLMDDGTVVIVGGMGSTMPPEHSVIGELGADAGSTAPTPAPPETPTGPAPEGQVEWSTPETESTEDDDLPADGTISLSPITPLETPKPEAPPPQFMGVFDHDDETVDVQPPPDMAGSSPDVVVESDESDDATITETASTQPAPSGPSRTLVGSGVSVLIVALIAILVLVVRPFGPASSTGAGPAGGATTPAPGATQPAGTSPGSSTGPTTGLTLNNGAPMSGAAVLTNAQGGCAGFSSGGATSPSNTAVAAGKMILSIFAAGSLPMTGTASADGTYTVANADGSARAQGQIGTTGISGTLTVTRSGCIETIRFAIVIGSGGGTTGTPRPSAAASFVAIIIATNTITFGTKAIDFCHQTYTVTFTYVINGISPGTPVIVVLDGPGTPTAPQTFHASSGMKFGASYTVPGGGPGVWSSTVETINGDPPPIPSGEHESTSINC